MELTAPQGEHEITLYQQMDGGWTEFATGRGNVSAGATRSDVVQGLTEFVQEVLRNSSTPREERPLLHQVLASATVPPFGMIAVNGFGTEMVVEA
jgi:hypothetical protein